MGQIRWQGSSITDEFPALLALLSAEWAIFSSAPKRKKSKKSGSSGSVPEFKMGNKPPFNPKLIGIVVGVVVVAVVGSFVLNQLNQQNNSQQNQFSQGIERPGEASSLPVQAGTTNSSLPSALPSDRQRTTPNVAVTTPEVQPTENDPVSENPLVAMIKGQDNDTIVNGVDLSDKIPVNVGPNETLYMTQEEAKAFERGELLDTDIERIRQRSNLVNSPGSPEMASSPTPTPPRGGGLFGNGFGGLFGGAPATPPPSPNDAAMAIPGTESTPPLAPAELNLESLKPALAHIAVIKNDGQTSTATGCIVNSQGGMVVPFSVLNGGKDLSVEFDGKKLGNFDVSVGMVDANTRMVMLALPPSSSEGGYPAVALAASLNPDEFSSNLSQTPSPLFHIVSNTGQTLEKHPASVQPITFQFQYGDKLTPIAGSWMKIQTQPDINPLGQPVFNNRTELAGFGTALALVNPTAYLGVGSESFNSFSSATLDNQEDVASAASQEQAAFSEGDNGSAPAELSDEQISKKVVQMILAQSICETDAAKDLLTSLRWMHVAVLNQTRLNDPAPNDSLGRFIIANGIQSIEKSGLSLPDRERGLQEGLLLCVVDYDRNGRPGETVDSNASTAFSFRLLAFGKDATDPSGSRYLRIWESDPFTTSVPSTTLDQGLFSRSMKDQIAGMYTKYRSGLLKARRELGRE